ncbi:hypothetical protein [Sphingomonas sp. LT1P40]|uniref:hypothetical protein n=1 Tax=Alteristakelama amylovorans TaxID=3096166 RepID=UPI002FCA4563
MLTGAVLDQRARAKRRRSKHDNANQRYEDIGVDQISPAATARRKKRGGGAGGSVRADRWKGAERFMSSAQNFDRGGARNGGHAAIGDGRMGRSGLRESVEAAVT